MMTMRSAADDMWMTYLPADNVRMTCSCRWRVQMTCGRRADDMHMTPGVVLHEIRQLRQVCRRRADDVQTTFLTTSWTALHRACWLTCLNSTLFMTYLTTMSWNFFFNLWLVWPFLHTTRIRIFTLSLFVFKVYKMCKPHFTTLMDIK